MTTYDAHGPGPVWHTEDKAPLYPDERFDGYLSASTTGGLIKSAPPLIPDASTPVWESEMGMAPPPDPQQSPPICEICDQPIDGFWHRNIGGGPVCPGCCTICRNERISRAARLAADDMTTVMRHWTFSAISELPNLRALLRLLTPPAPKWTKDEDK